MSDRVFNINVGVLGHVDSGKTALVAALSDVLSTAALDKSPASKERGITLDLGFSAFRVPCPADFVSVLQADHIQFTLVDCPGHASLMKTVLVGAHVLDIMLLVVDSCKGIQAQTAESIVVGELLSSMMVVALNKTDLLPSEKRSKHLRRAGQAVLQALQLTRFADSAIVPCAARVGGGAEGPSEGIEALKDMLLQRLPYIQRSPDAPFLFVVDHCFMIKGQGTVLTGTVLRGSVKVGDTVELPSLKEQRKVKSIQSFHKPVTSVSAGDRAGICVTQLQARGIERTMLSAPNTVPTFEACVCRVELCRFYTGKVLSNVKAHVTIGHQTSMAQPIFFGVPGDEGMTQEGLLADSFKHVGKFAAEQEVPFDLNKAYVSQDQLFGFTGRPGDAASTAPGEPAPDLHYGPEWVVLLFEKPMLAPTNSIFLGTRMDMALDDSEPACRVAFYGNVVHVFKACVDHKQLRLYKTKSRLGVIDRMDRAANTMIIKDMFKKETDLSAFTGLQVVAAGGLVGTVEQPFGKSGKVRASFPNGLPPDGTADVKLHFRKYIFDSDKKRVAQ